MEQLKTVIWQMIAVSDDEMNGMLSKCAVSRYPPKDFLSKQGEVSDSIFFILSGTTRSLIQDQFGEEHTIHFSLENQFVADYTSFMLRLPAMNSIQAVEETRAVVMPRECIEWGYSKLKTGR